MQRIVIIAAIVITLISSGKIDLYPETANVVSVVDDVVTVETFSGNLFSFSDDDYEIGDTVSMIMYGNFTDSVHDDRVIMTQYAGFYRK